MTNYYLRKISKQVGGTLQCLVFGKNTIIKVHFIFLHMLSKFFDFFSTIFLYCIKEKDKEISFELLLYIYIKKLQR